MTTFSSGMIAAHCIALNAPRIISMKLEGAGT
jgi:hypothetical protein